MDGGAGDISATSSNASGLIGGCCIRLQPTHIRAARVTSAPQCQHVPNSRLSPFTLAAKRQSCPVVGPRTTVTTNWGDENYDFDIALPVDRADAQVADPVKAGNSYGGKALVVSFTGTAAQLPLMRLVLKAYAYTHGYVFDESSEGNGRFYDQLTNADAKADDSSQAFSVFLPIQSQ